jgi:Choline dehydrogenase and related flavoproteins
MINSETTACDEFDMVIIGAGPSAIGLLYGLLRPYSTGPKAAATGDHDDQHHTSSAPPPFKIAIIERGPLFCSNDKSSPSSSPTNKNPLLQVQQDPKLWFCAAHPSSSNPLENILYKRDEKKEPYSSIVYRTVPQTRGLGNRVLSVPTGQGLGGGTNINACLFVRPTKDDFEHWPNYWKESVLGEDHVMRPRIMQSVVQIERIMRNNGALVDQQEEAEIMIHRNDDDDHSDVIMSEREIIKEEAIKDNKNNASTSTGLYLDYEKIMLTQPKKKNDKIWKRRWKLGKVTSTIRQKDVNSSEGSLGTKGNTYERVNYYQGILKPLLEENPNMGKSLQFFTGVLAERLLMHRENDSNVVTAKGVECSHVGAKGEKVLFTIRGKIVVVCAGAILTPALLLASGIGEERELRNQAVTPILEGEDNVWKGVGKRLCDHVIVATGFGQIDDLHLWTFLIPFEDGWQWILQTIGIDIIFRPQNIRLGCS